MSKRGVGRRLEREAAHCRVHASLLQPKLRKRDVAILIDDPPRVGRRPPTAPDGVVTCGVGALSRGKPIDEALIEDTVVIELVRVRCALVPGRCLPELAEVERPG